MHIVNDPPLLPAWLVTKLQSPELVGTFIVKGTFRLRPGAPAVPAEEPIGPTGDLPSDPEKESSLRYASDFAPFKPKTDLLVVGTACAPEEKAVDVLRVTAQIGAWSKSLAVIGDRARKKTFFGTGASEPLPFVRMPLSYERAFGGPGFPANPVGIGFRMDRLPNLEDPARLMMSSEDTPAPVGFGPIPPHWPQRQGDLGTFDNDWLRTRWPWLPTDFEWSHFNAAPKDQRIPATLRGDEPVCLEYLHPGHPKYRSALPGLRPRCFLHERIAGALQFREVPLKLDTVWIDMDAENLVLVWRGHVPVRSLRLRELQHLYVAAERVGDTPRPSDHHRAELNRRLPRRFQFAPVPEEPEKPAPPPPPEPELKAEEEALARLEAEAARSEEQARTQLLRMGFVAPPATAPPPDLPALYRTIHSRYAQAFAGFRKSFPHAPDLPNIHAELFQPPPIPREEPSPESPERAPWTRESVAQGARSGTDFSGEDLRELDLSDLDLSGGRFAGANLSKCRLSRSNLSRADLREADLSAADLSEADLSDANLELADLTGALLPKARLPRVKLRWTEFRRAVLTDSDFTAASGSAAFAESRLDNTRFREASLSPADFDGAALPHADFTSARIPGASFQGVRAPGIVLEGADLTRLHGGGGSDLTAANLRGIRGAESVWEGARLDRADFTRALLVRADFTDASLQEAIVIRAEMRKARFPDASLLRARILQTNACQALFERADLREADLSGSNFYDSQFWDARLEGANLLHANLKGTSVVRP